VDIVHGGQWGEGGGNSTYKSAKPMVDAFVKALTKTQLISMLGTEAIKASDQLLEQGIYANVIMVTSPDLLIGTLGMDRGYQHLRHNLQIDSTLHIRPTGVSDGATGNTLDVADLVTLSGRRVPIVSVHDGEPGLLDNIGSIIGVRHESLAVRKHSRCGRPVDVYQYHHIDSDSVMAACLQVLGEVAIEQVRINANALQDQRLHQ